LPLCTAQAAQGMQSTTHTVMLRHTMMWGSATHHQPAPRKFQRSNR